MGEIIAIANQKGGVGKSTTAAALGDALRRGGAKVLYVDLDPQGNLTHSLCGVPSPEGLRLTDLMVKGGDIVHAIQHVKCGDLIASDTSLVGADITMTDALPRREFGLRSLLAPIQEAYDYMLIDTPPTLGLLALNSITASNSIIIPACPDIYSLQGIGQLFQTIEMVRRYYNPFAIIRGILLTRHDKREKLGREIGDLLERVAERIGTKVFNTVIRESVAIRNAQKARESIFDFDPTGHAAEDYKALADELTALTKKVME